MWRVQTLRVTVRKLVARQGFSELRNVVGLQCGWPGPLLTGRDGEGEMIDMNTHMPAQTGTCASAHEMQTIIHLM